MFEQLAAHIASRVKNGDALGLGTGRTAEAAIVAIGERIAKEGLKVSGMATSDRAAQIARQAGITLLDPLTPTPLSWAFDGADEVDPQLVLIKGGGGALLREKMVATRAGGLVVIVTEEKLVKHLGERFALPIEVVPEAIGFVGEKLKILGATESVLRTQKDSSAPFLTDHGNVILDTRFSNLTAKLDPQLKALTGVVDHGLFVGLANEVIVAKKTGLVQLTAK